MKSRFFYSVHGPSDILGMALPEVLLEILPIAALKDSRYYAFSQGCAYLVWAPTVNRFEKGFIAGLNAMQRHTPYGGFYCDLAQYREMLRVCNFLSSWILWNPSPNT